MGNERTKSPIEIAATLLRERAMESEEGALIGSESSMVERLGVSRVTVRQAARLIEREGLLRVRRGTNGGYFASRPSSELIESMVCGYLERAGVKPAHTGVVGTALWMEAMRTAAGLRSPEAQAFVDTWRARLAEVGAEPTMSEVARFELDYRTALFNLIDGQYMDLIFRINVAFTLLHIGEGPSATADPAVHRKFVELWRQAKALELGAIAEGDPRLALMAGRHNRNLWEARRHNNVDAFSWAGRGDPLY